MTAEQHILLHLYATQKVYLTRITELICAVKEQQESGAEPTGMLSAVVLADIEQLTATLVDALAQSMPPGINYGFKTEADPEEIDSWINNAVYDVFTDNNKNEE